MTPLEITSVATLALAIISIAFTVWGKITTPQKDLDKQQALTEKDVDTKAGVLAIQFQNDRETTRDKFKEMGERLDNAFTMASNHTHTVDIKVDKLIEGVNSMNLSMTKELATLTAIINERIPKRDI